MRMRIVTRQVTLLFVLLVLLGSMPAMVLADGPRVLPDYGNFVTTNCLFADGFASYEPVALWVQHPDGYTEAAIPSSTTLSNAKGQLGPQETDLFAGNGCFFSTPEWKNGEYMVVARGLKSGYEVTAKFFYAGEFPTGTPPGLYVQAQHNSPADTPWFTYTGYGFNPFSRIAIWLGTPDGKTQIPLESVAFTDDKGVFRATVYRSELDTAGDYRIVASDGKHEYWTTITFLLNDANTLKIPSGVGMKFTPSAGPYTTWFMGVATGLTPYETVDVWLELPNGTIFSDVRAADDKGRVYEIWQSFVGEPIGDYHFVARGRTSRVQVDGKFTVIDVMPNP